ncbi:type 11 methyltransferase [Alicyclobacillus acidocaldarius]|uniref:Methyltransferase type 11 n=1 Tax=Alicyclobacillus acidocaldarius (strain Tc-4-1) TaxID=1048834 RepID=F8IF78_ALIAT|nr:type 11 methyltransferase [Alicyclobacillus acidocaldarius]AEJ44043.1 Methyltransferase type 11 [Alicyclobacillus acidocaldarius subsp. acidocaldarius Tc-4-1]
MKREILALLRDPVLGGPLEFVGGINFFTDPARAMQEMMRIAKPGTKVVVVDETERKVRSTYERVPFVRRWFRDRGALVGIPIHAVPKMAEDVRVQELDGGNLYGLTFRKPLGADGQTPGRRDLSF